MDFEVVEHDLARFLIKQGAKLLDHVVVQPTTMTITRVTFPNDTLPIYEQVTLVDVPQLNLNTSPSATNDIDTVVTLHDYDAYTIARLGELMLAGTPFTLLNCQNQPGKRMAETGLLLDHLSADHQPGH